MPRFSRDCLKQDGDTKILLKLEAWVLGGLMAAAMLGLAWHVLSSVPAHAHPGGLAADGCHNDRKNGGRHCHRGGSVPKPSAQRAMGSSDHYFPNCAAARAAGAAPVRRGDSGYASHLDRDNDGIGCE